MPLNLEEIVRDFENFKPWGELEEYVLTICRELLDAKRRIAELEKTPPKRRHMAENGTLADPDCQVCHGRGYDTQFRRCDLCAEWTFKNRKYNE